ncbi:MAG: Calx-beta domain protein [Planctomycetaceae bacterium]|nr:Calx-beta domain protein [Planctomycetaceae bacterium]
MKFWSRPLWSSLFPHVSCAARARRRQAGKLTTLEQLESREMLTAFLVTSTADTTDAGTLRWAIEQANANVGVDTITFDATFDSAQTITLGGTQLPTLTDATGQTIITGPGVDLLTISGNAQSRIFRIADGVSVAIDGIRMANGKTDLNDGLPDLGNGAGIMNYGQLTLSHVIMTEFHGNRIGGAINNQGTLTISDSTISHSSANQGGAINSEGTVIASHVAFLNNSAMYAGGAILSGGATLLSNCLIDGNTVDPNVGLGGGVFQGESETGMLSITTSTLSNNSGGAFGGALFNHGQATIASSAIYNNTSQNGGGIENDNYLRVVNSTLTANTAEYGGAIRNMGLMEIFNATISGNTATIQGAGIDQYFNNPAGAYQNTIVAGNLRNGIADNIAGSINPDQSRNNLFGPGSESFVFPDMNGNIDLNADDNIGLGPLSDNGGPTLTMPLLANSPAIDAGTLYFPSGTSTGNDQRGAGYSRMQGIFIDIGAVESTYAHGHNIVDENENAVAGIFWYSPGGSYPQTYSLSGGEDSALFTLDEESGALRFASPPNFEHPADANSDNIYQFQVTLTNDDGSTIEVPWTVRVRDVLEYPTITLSEQPATYKLGDAPLVDSGASFHTEQQNITYAGGKLVVSATHYLPDMLKIVSQGNKAGQISVRGKNVLYGGRVIGTFEGGNRKHYNLEVTFTGAANEAAVNALVKQIGFTTKYKNFPQEPRTFAMQIIGLYGLDGNYASRQINVVGRS